MSKTVSEIFLWVILASALVLIIMNASGFAQATTAVGTQVNDLSRTLSGSGYVNRRAA